MIEIRRLDNGWVVFLFPSGVRRGSPREALVFTERLALNDWLEEVIGGSHVLTPVGPRYSAVLAKAQNGLMVSKGGALPVMYRLPEDVQALRAWWAAQP